MTNPATLKVSYHFQNTRNERKARIDSIINGNWGSPVREVWYKDAWRIMTDAGLIFIVEPKKEIILTYYFATPSVAAGMFQGRVPEAIKNKVRKNAQMYLEKYGEEITQAYKIKA